MDWVCKEGPDGHAERGATGLRVRLVSGSDWLASPDAKPLKGFGSAGVIEIVEDWRGDAYRAVYTVRFAQAVYVLHCFQKKAKRGIATPKKEMDLIRERLKQVEKLAKGVET